MYEKYTGTQIQRKVIMFYSYSGNSVQRKRLKRFINFLRRADKKNFDLATVCNTDVGNPFLVVDRFKKHSCGTTACVYGLLPVYNPSMFYYQQTCQISNKYFSYSVRIYNNKVYGIHYTMEWYFGISEYASDILFFDSTYDTTSCWYGKNIRKITPKMVADKLEQLINGKLKVKTRK